MRLTKIYTRTGDAGYTNHGKKKIAKDDNLIESIGTIDELNCAIGLSLANIKDKTIFSCLTQVQHDLFDLGGELFLPDHPVITADKVTWLEQRLDEWNDTLPPLTEFILPRGHQAVASCHLARAICRRAERCLVRQHRQSPLANLELLRYINRLSDLLFVLTRVLGREEGDKETLWEHKK